MLTWLVRVTLCYSLRMHADIDGFTMPAPEAVDSAAEKLRILSDPTRLRILWALSQGESSVACLAELSDANPTSVSQHLAKLRLAGLVRARRQGTFMFYVIVDPQLQVLLETVMASTAPSDARKAMAAS
jgi:DNA-binding transcriptional ArsR family regulator